MSTYRTSDGDTADLIAHRAYGATAGMTEALLDANPGLAAAGPVLPAGMLVALPAPPAPQPRRPIRLWE